MNRLLGIYIHFDVIERESEISIATAIDPFQLRNF